MVGTWEHFMEISERIARYLSACPPAIAGQGGHNQTFSVACSLCHGFSLSEEETFYWLQQYNARCSPEWSEAELLHKAKSAANAASDKPRGYLLGYQYGNADLRKSAQTTPSQFMTRQQTPQHRIDPATCIENFLKGFACSENDLYEASPIKPELDYTQDGILLVGALFRPGEIVNFVSEFTMTECKDGAQKAVPYGYGESVDRDSLICRWQINGMPEADCGGWMRMNPMNGEGVADKCVSVFRHVLLEFDNIPTDLQISLFAKLPLPISCILTSGGKSVHAWVRVDAEDMVAYKDTSVMLLKMLERFGLDGKNKNPSRLSRLPGVRRKFGATGDGRQRLLYLNQNPVQKAIIP